MALLLRTVQCSILGPVLYSIFVIIDNDDLLAFADDLFIPRWNINPTDVIANMEKLLELITK
jgi:hypothetical protein